MAKEKQRKNSKYEALDVLNDIRSRYSRISASNIEKFAPVYYPVAIVEMKLEERTFEDFETVHLTILRLMALGISDREIIAHTLGLSPNYVSRIMRILSGYGHISGTELTDLGRESLANEKKIVTTQTLQKFQVDALNGTLLKVQETVTASMLNSRDQTNLIIGHLDYLDGMTAESLSAQLTGNGCESYLHQKSGILHTNVTAVTDARCVDIKYAKCYLLKLKGQDYPIIFTKRYNKNEKEMKNRFYWHPFSVHDPHIISRYGFESNLPISTDLANDYVLKLYAMMLEQAQRVNLNEEIPKAVARAYPFQEAGLHIPPADPDSELRVLIREEALTHYRKQLISILYDIHNDGCYLLTSEYLYGHMVSIQTDSPKIHHLADLLSRKIDLLGKVEITQKLGERFKDREVNGSIVDDLIAELLNI